MEDAGVGSHGLPTKTFSHHLRSTPSTLPGPQLSLSVGGDCLKGGVKIL